MNGFGSFFGGADFSPKSWPTSAVGEGDGWGTGAGEGEGEDEDGERGDGDGESCSVALKFVAPAITNLESPGPPQLVLQLLLPQHVAGTPDARASFWAAPGSSRSNSIRVCDGWLATNVRTVRECWT